MNPHNTPRKTSKRNATGFTIKVVLDDTVPAFGGYKLGSLKNGTATILLNAHACKEAAPDAELSVKEMVIETLMHEFGHCLEEYFELDPNENRVETLVETYRSKPSGSIDEKGQDIYDVLYENSNVDGTRIIHEDVWPIRELAHREHLAELRGRIDEHEKTIDVNPDMVFSNWKPEDVASYFFEIGARRRELKAELNRLEEGPACD